ncbi:MAG: glycosyltransferase [Candidatus Woykebacteria bacterium]
MNSELKTHHPHISVVIPAFNEEKYLPKCLESLRSQDYPNDNYEIIVVDNNSTDGTVKVAEKYGARVIGCQVQGVSVSRQAGGQAAFGEIIAGTDSDTIVAPNWLSIIEKSFKDPKVAAITAGAEFHSTGLINKTLAKYGFPFFMQLQFLLGKPALNGFSFAIKKETFDKIGGFNLKLASAEDVDLGIRASKEGKVLYVPELKVYTSARRMEKSRIKFFWHHFKNIIRFTLLKKDPESFEAVR